MGDVRTLVSDPEFQNLPVAKQREALSRFDPEFSKLGDEEIGRFRIKIASPPSGVEKFFNPQTPGVESRVPETQKIRNLSDVGASVTRAARPFVTGLGTAAGIAAAPASGGSSLIPALAGIFGGIGTDLAMQSAEKGFSGKAPQPFIQTDNPVSDALQGSAETLGGNELGGMIFNKVLQFGKGLIRPPAYESVSPVNQRLGDVYSQMIEKGGGPSYSQQNPGLIKKGFEDILGGEAKHTQLRNAATAGRKVGEDTIKGITANFNPANPSLGIGFKDPAEAAQLFKTQLESKLKENVKLSNAHADKAKLIAQANPGFAQSNVMNGVVTNSQFHQLPDAMKVRGPIAAQQMVLAADRFLTDQFGAKYFQTGTDNLFKILADEEKPLVRTALDILNYANRDRNGNIVGIRAMPFEQAWKFKKAAGGIGYGDENLVKSYKNANFVKLSEAADNDIEKSMSQWSKYPQKAINAYQQAKTIVSNRHDLYQQGDAIERLLKTETGQSGVPEFDAILRDPLQVGKAIAASGPGGRANLQAYQFQRVLDNSFDQEAGTFDRTKLINQWKDPDKQAVYNKLYTSAQRSQLDNFIEALGNVSQKQSKAGVMSTAIHIGNTGVNIAGSLLAGLMGTQTSNRYMATGSMILGGTLATSEFVKRVLLNPKIARGATILMNLPPTSGEAKFLSRQLFTALEGAAIVLNDGSKGEIKDGKVQIK